MRGPNFTKLGVEIRPSSLLTEFVSELRYLAPSLTASQRWGLRRGIIEHKLRLIEYSSVTLLITFHVLS